MGSGGARGPEYRTQKQEGTAVDNVPLLAVTTGASYLFCAVSVKIPFFRIGKNKNKLDPFPTEMKFFFNTAADPNEDSRSSSTHTRVIFPHAAKNPPTIQSLDAI